VEHQVLYCCAARLRPCKEEGKTLIYDHLIVIARIRIRQQNPQKVLFQALIVRHFVYQRFPGTYHLFEEGAQCLGICFDVAFVLENVVFGEARESDSVELLGAEDHLGESASQRERDVLAHFDSIFIVVHHNVI